MPKTAKKITINQAITALEKSRNSKAIVYITGDRKPEKALSTLIASDVIPLFRDVLKNIGKTNKITLALYTNGGHLDTPWPLVNLIREYCEEFEVIILDKALSAGTLIALGSDQIVMTPYSFLSPIDPAADIQVENNQTKHFEIEDIIGYLDFVKQKMGITQQNALSEIMKDLTKEITPTILGSVNRTHSLIRMLAKNLLEIHKKPVPQKQIKEIVEHLTQKLFSHRHLISRREARNIGLNKIIQFTTESDEAVIQDLMDCYRELLSLDDELDPAVVIGKLDKTNLSLSRAVIHSSKLKFTFNSNCVIQRVVDPAGNPQFAVNFTSHKWLKK